MKELSFLLGIISITTSLGLALNSTDYSWQANQIVAAESNTNTVCDSSLNTSSSVTMTDENNGQIVTLKQSQMLFVRLASNPGTGYGWQLAESNKNQLKLLGNPVLEPAIKPQPNSTIYQVFHFQVKSAGSSVLELHNQPRGQNNTPSNKTYRLNVQMSSSPVSVGVNDSDNNKEVNLNSGDILVVRLATNPATGYSWKLPVNSQNKLKLLESSVEKSTDSKPGSTAYQILRFQVNSPGSSLLELQYRPQRLNNSLPEKNYRIYVQTNTRNGLIRLTDSDNNSQVRATVGNTLIVRLALAPGNNYTWQVVKNNSEKLASLGNPVLEQTGNQYKVFCFQGQSLGSSLLEFHYNRPWEKEQPPLNTYKLNVQILN
ncbi:protease inhibitor I42 family protein [Microcoleus sp. EPA2]|uniref:protease inhibitor I42 family protein n=1 Tax=Microcoleus sp. EPA2 TaxID=2841654 RepID=UPI00312B8B94